MSKFLQRLMVIGAAILLPMTLIADDFQLPDPHFEDWGGEKFDGQEQAKYWHASNVQQEALGMTLKFNFAHKETGRSGYCIMAQDQKVGVSGIVEETSPSYYSLGYAWAYLEGLNTGSATAGTYGGYAFKHRPDTVSIWIKRTGSNWDKEDFHILFYSWSGTAKGTSYKNKNGECTAVNKENEESDIRQALDGNQCKTTTTDCKQIAEAWVHDRKQYTNWVNLRIPVYYLESLVPTMCNLILSASNYPNYRSNSGLYEGNSLYVDDVELIYASTIQKLFINDKEWSEFNPNTSEVQYYELSESATDIPSIEARRGVGSLTNVPNQSTTKTQKFPGRVLSGSEISIVKGDLENTPTVITVKSEDGKSTSTYRIQFKKAAGSNAKLASISVNGTPLSGFAPAKFNYTVELPYGTTAVPVVTAEKQEDEQTVEIKQATSVTGTATITVTAANGTTKETYNITFKVGQLADNTLKMIYVNGKAVPGFTPTQAVYKVSLPVGTTVMPTVVAESAYPEGEQTIVYEAPSVIDGGQYKISVTTPGNTVAKVYKLNFKLEASSYKYLADIQLVGNQVAKVIPGQPDDPSKILFTPENLTYDITLKKGTTTLPDIQYTPGDEFQNITLTTGGLEGTSRITVTAGNGDQAVYKLNFKTEKSTNSKLDGILIGGEPLEGFDPNVTSYSVQLPIGTTTLPEITPIAADEFQQIVVTTAGVNGVTRITVTAGNGSTTIYQIAFSVNAYTDNTLKSLTVEGYDIGFEPTKNEYWVNLPQGTTELPKVNYELQDPQFQTANERPLTSGLTGDYKITVRPQSGASRTYVIHFTLATSSNTALEMIYFDGKPMKCWNGTDSIAFDPEVLEYTHKLPEGESKLPTVTVKKGEDSQRVLNVLENKVQSITVTAESGATRTYTITFVVTVSANAYLEMIYLDNKPLEGFRRDSFEYVKQLDSITCPKITVDKAAGQQVTITAPYAAGKAYIKVVAGTGDFSTYTIDFKAGAVASVRLKGILVNGSPIEGFDATTLNYEATYEGNLPTVEGVTENDNQTVQVRWKDNTAYLYVSDKEGNQATYSVTFTRELSENNELEGIYEDFGEGAQLIGGFTKTKKHYSYDLPAGSALPVVTYEAAATAQVVFFGQLEYGKWGVTVEAEKGDTTTYTVTYNILPYDDATLANLFVKGERVPGFNPNNFRYTWPLDNGANLPKVTVESKPGQRVLIQSVGDSTQVFVYAESGRNNTYTINYTRKTSSNALLADILIDGVSIEGFAEDKFEYIDSLDRTNADGDTIKVIPNVFPIGQLSNQTITTYFSRLNGTTRINVVAEDGTEQDYFVEFPVRKLDNNKLRNLDIQHGEAVLSFRPDVTDYEVELPYEDIICPPLIIEKGETHQRVDIISRPVGDTTKVIVYAENGNPNTYNILFKREILQDENRLSMIRIVELDKELSLKDKNKRDFEVEMPYGSRTLTVEYAKNYTAQTVFVEPGGVNHPTVITVKANNGDVADEVYRIIPIVEDKNPAVITSMTLNGEPMPGFDPYKYSYIVPVENKHIIRYTINKGADINILEQNEKHWQAEVLFNGIVTTYDLWFYYINDVLPNTDFAEWEDAAYKGRKPVGWNTLGNVTEGKKFPLVGTYTTGNEVTQDGTNSVAKMETKYNAFPLGGYVPAYITLGNIWYDFSVAAGSDFGVTGGMTFRNSPDVLKVVYKQPAVSSNGRIVYQITGSLSSQELVTPTEKISDYTTVEIDLKETNAAAGVPQNMNVILNSYESESSKNGLEAGSATLYVDKAEFLFNHTLTGMKVDAFDITPSGNAFTATLEDPERIELPVLKFTGEVDDQAQDVTWNDNLTLSEDGNYEVRTADIRNWAENGVDYSDYTLTVRRPLDTRNQLKDLLLDSVRIKDFSETNYAYEIKMSPSEIRLPDIMPIPESSRQTIATSFDESTSTFTITVTPEKGEAKTYTVHFTTEWSDDTTLSNISAEGVSYDAGTPEYTVKADELPVITFTKKSDMQLVSLVNGVITVTAEDGEHTGTYTIKLAKPDYNPNGVISQFRYNNQPDDDNFGGDNTEKTEKRPEGAVFFTRAADRDSVVFVQTETNMTWTVPGASNIYIWTFKEDGVASSNADLAGLNVNEDPYQEFSADKTSYMITSDTTVVVEAVLAEAVQQLTTTISVNGDTITYAMDVTAEDGTTTKGYSMRITRQKHNINTLAGILVDGEPIREFEADLNDYTIVLPLPDDGVKRVQPQMPSITYIAGDERQQITLTPGKVGDDPTIIAVRSEDGKGEVNEYNVTVVAEKSHCADLTGITVNGVALDHFEPGRHYYSTTLPMDEIEVDYTSDDRFQNVNIWREIVKAGQSYIYYLDVTAEDGTTSQYQVEIYIENQSNDAQLANIFLDRKAFVDFERALNDNPPLAFDPGSNNYKINLPAGTEILPEVSAQLKMPGQEVEIRHIGADSILLHVTAVDKVSTNDYKLHFVVPLSKNANLDMIYINGDSLEGFDKEHYFYKVDLPVGTDKLPEVVGQQAEASQTVSKAEWDGMQATIKVQAEDPETRPSTYVVLFSFTQSDVDTLAMIYADGDTLEGFAPRTYYYKQTLPVGTTVFPNLEWVEGDDYQDVKLQTVSESAESLVRQIIVTAQSGKKATYTVAYEIAKSSVDTLQMIRVDRKPLEGFRSDVYEYFYHLSVEAAEVFADSLILVDCTLGDNYQDTSKVYVPETMSGKTLGYKTVITVTAQTGAERIYTIHYPVDLSDEATLENIYLNGAEISGFSDLRFNYREEIGMTDAIPVVTVDKKEEAQTVDIKVENEVVRIIVTAEDGQATNTYVITFERLKSDECDLKEILLTNVEGTRLTSGEFPYRPDYYEYIVNMPYDGTLSIEDQIPAIDYITYDDEQVVSIDYYDLANGDVKAVVTVIAPNGIDQHEYSITFHWLKPDDADLIAIILNGDTLANFHPGITEYTYAHPYGSTTADYFTTDQVGYVLSDSLATAEVMIREDGTIFISVIAQSGYENPYVIRQKIADDGDNALAWIKLDNNMLEGFDPDETFYTYYLLTGKGVPSVDAKPRSDNALGLSIREASAGDTCLIICTAADGSERRYYIHFAISAIDPGLEPTANDVFIKRIPGTNQIFISTIRKGVSFALYNHTGRLVYTVQLDDVADPNYTRIATDTYEHDILTDVLSWDSGKRIDIEPGEIYIYTFFKSDSSKKIFKSGKFRALPVQ